MEIKISKKINNPYQGIGSKKELKVPRENKDISRKIGEIIASIKKRFSKELEAYNCLWDARVYDKEYISRKSNKDFKTGQFIEEILSHFERWKIETLFLGINKDWVKNTNR